MMKTGLYQVECLACGDWMPLSVWKILPADLSRFLDYLYLILYSSACQDSKNMLRVKRVSSRPAEWEFLGYGHVSVKAVNEGSQ